MVGILRKKTRWLIDSANEKRRALLPAVSRRLITA
jgi:hypothetical protein